MKLNHRTKPATGAVSTETDILGKLRDAMAGAMKDTIGVQPGFLRPIDTDAIARQLDLDRKAEAAGKRNQPETDAAVHDSVELEIIQKISSEWAWQREEFLSQLRAYAARLAQFSIKAEFAKLQLLGRDALAKLRAASREAGAHLGPLKEGYVEARDELRRFRQKHRLQRPAITDNSRLLAFGLLFFILALETILNGFFFQAGSAFGLLGGIGTALGISATNVGLAFVTGLAPLRWLNRRNWLVKLVALLLLLVAFAAIAALHVFSAQFRDVTIVLSEAGGTFTEQEAFRQAIEELKARPLQFSDINSYYLMLMGLLFSLLAMWKGYTFDDPYPGYGPVTRRRDKAQDEYTDEHGDLFGDLEEAKDETVSAIDAGIAKLPGYPQTAAAVEAQRAALVANFRVYEATVNDAVNQLLQRYRDVNKRFRSSPPPAHFGREWRLPQTTFDTTEVAALMQYAPEQVSDLNAPLAELRQLSTEVIEEYEALLERYPHSTDME